MTDVLKCLREAVFEYDRQKAADCAQKAVEEVDPIEALDVLTSAIKEVGDRFGKEELWLPDLIGAAAAMQAAMPVLLAQIQKLGKKRESLGRVVIGTVLGDIHNIGKDMVATLLTASGFEVIDLGVDVSAARFVNAVKENEANLLAMSSLMTMTAPEQEKVIIAFKKESLRDKVKIMLGGGAITKEFAEGIGADGYGATAFDAVLVARQLSGIAG